MNRFEWNSLEIDGKVVAIDYAERPSRTDVVQAKLDEACRIANVSLEYTLSDVDADAFLRFMRELEERARTINLGADEHWVLVTTPLGNESNATLHTLMRRGEYGGRKGRRAWRRLESGAWGPSRVLGNFAAQRGTAE